MSFMDAESLMSIVHFYGLLCFVCYKFMVFEVCNSMEMNFWVGFSDGVDLLLQLSWSWMKNANHIADNWLVLEMGGKQMRVDNGL
jgi:hypothetical protein